ncbi:MAG: C25 family cysteine peptidase [Candidatus Krumholzibacteriia bacterium]
MLSAAGRRPAAFPWSPPAVVAVAAVLAAMMAAVLMMSAVAAPAQTADDLALPGKGDAPAVAAPVPSDAVPADTVPSDAVPSGPGPERVIFSDGEMVRFRVENGAPRWALRSLRGGALELYEPLVDGYVNGGVPARPALPRRGGWILVPPGTRPELRVVEETWEDAGGRPLMVVPTPVVPRAGAAEGEAPRTLAEQILLPGEDPGGDAVVSPRIREQSERTPVAVGGPAVRLGEASFWRGRRVADYAITAVQSDEAGRATRYLAAGTYEIRFVPEPRRDPALARAAGTYARRLTGRGDERFGFLFLNGGQLPSLPTEAAAGEVAFDRPLAAADPARTAGYEPARGGQVTPLTSEIKLVVRRTRLYRVTAQSLRDRGLITDPDVREDQIRLYQRRYVAELDTCAGCSGPPWIEVEVPVHLVGDGGTFAGDDAFFFQGLRLRDDHAHTADLGAGPVEVPGAGDPFEMNNAGNIYWLAFAEPPAGGGWSRMATTTLPAAAGPPEPRYRRSDHFEEAVAFRTYVPNRLVDRVYANNYFDTAARLGITFWSPDPAGGPVDLTAQLAAHDNNARTLAFDLEAGGVQTPLGQYETVNRSLVTFETTLAPSQITARTMDLVMTRGGGLMLFGYLNWAQVEYDALFKAIQGELLFPGGDQPGVNDIEVTGFADSDLGLVDVTDPRRPVRVQLGPENVQPDGDGYRLSLRVDQSEGRRRFFVDERMFGDGTGEILAFLATRVDDPDDPTVATGGAPDLVVISHPVFTSGLDRWIRHRQDRAGGDLAAHVVEVDDLYDWYNGGLRDPWALKRFTTHAINRWGSWALVLVGDANENALELGVTSAARPYATDWVPTHLHGQALWGYDPALLASDKWYAVPAADDDNWPEWYGRPPSSMLTDMYVGRFPCNSTADLEAMIDKIIATETVQPGETWRRRGIFMADDAWSSGFITDGGGAYLRYDGGERDFQNSEELMAQGWEENAAGVALTADRQFLDSYLPESDPALPRNWGQYREYAASYALQPLLASLSAGGLLVHYQGHANENLLAHETWFEDEFDPLFRRDVSSLANRGRYWVFFGMGCHVTHLAQSTVYPATGSFREPSLGEKLVTTPGKGAVATYGSSGYEYRDTNKRASELMHRRWVFEPPTVSVAGEAVHSRWVLGELLWAGEADVLATWGNNDPRYRELVAQFLLMGDPLMVLDAGAAEVTATLRGSPDQEIGGEQDLVALDATNVRRLTLDIGDEAGVARVLVRDSEGVVLADVRDPADGGDVAEISFPLAPQSHQRALAELSLPVRPFDHSLTVHVFDTADRSEQDDHWQVRLHQRQTAVFVAEGAPIDPQTYEFPLDTPVAVSAVITGAAWLDDGTEVALTGRNLGVSNLQVEPLDGRTLELSFTAVAHADTQQSRAVLLSIDGYETEHVLVTRTGPGQQVAVTDLFCYPNPLRDATRFVFRSGASAAPGRVLVYTVSGRHVADLPFTYGGTGDAVVDWNARDREGDRLANGVYLYRVVLDTAAGRVASDMQRLVIMQ